MKERPIIFSSDMVKAILDGRKTQTRRILSTLNKQWKGKQPLEILPMKTPNEWVGLMQRDPNRGIVFKCRLGVPRDRLWVRESFYTESGDVWYKADGQTAPMPIKWRPSIFMPRWASRILLEITEVRVERLQSITEEDAEAEGLNPAEYDNPNAYADLPCTNQFIALWGSLNAKRGYGWTENPFVWVISFRKLG